MSPEHGFIPQLSICTTSYNCARTIDEHLESVYAAIGSLPFEYAVVDNRSKDGTFEALKRAEAERQNITVVSMRCSRGVGRQRAAMLARADTILTLDTDTVYYPTLRSLVGAYLATYSPEGYAVQAIYAGLYPRQLWSDVGGMRDLNYGEDLDLWMRIAALGRMRWYPAPMGANIKNPNHQDSQDFLSPRYDRLEQFYRLFRRELDIWKLRRYYQLDLESIRQQNSIDLGLGEQRNRWFGPGPRATPRLALRRLRSDIPRLLLRTPPDGPGIRREG